MNNKQDKLNNIDIEKIRKAANDGKIDEFLSSNLSEQTAKKVKSVLSDKEAARKLLSTPQAKELMKKFSQNK